jgi:hypothetical protein
MRRLLNIAFFLVAFVASSLAVAQEKKSQKEEGFAPLFNGKDLAGWVVMGNKEGFQVKEGIIHSDGATGGNWLRTEKEYGNFILKVEWRVSKNGNSGVFVRSAEKGAPWETGYEVQISNEPRDDSHCTGSLYGYAAVKPRPDESADKWHTFEIQCKGPHITVIADGVKCIDFDQSTSDKTKGKPTKGFIGLQDSHSPKGHYIEYRNIRIKELE